LANNNYDSKNKNLSNNKIIQLGNNRNYNDIKERLKNNIKNELADQFKKKYNKFEINDDQSE